MNSRAVAVGWLFPDDRRHRRRGLDGAGARAAPNDPNLQAMSLNDPKIFIALLTWAHLFVRDVRAPHAGVERPPRGTFIDARVRLRHAELLAHQLFRDDEPYFLLTPDTCCASLPSRREPPHGARRSAGAS